MGEAVGKDELEPDMKRAGGIAEGQVKEQMQMSRSGTVPGRRRAMG